MTFITFIVFLNIAVQTFCLIKLFSELAPEMAVMHCQKLCKNIPTLKRFVKCLKDIIDKGHPIDIQFSYGSANISMKNPWTAFWPYSGCYMLFWGNAGIGAMLGTGLGAYSLY